MRYLTKKRVIVLGLLVLMVVIITTLVRCNNSTPTPTVAKKGNFNEEIAVQESKFVLEQFLKVSADKTFIANENEMDKIRGFVNNKCKQYFTEDFINDTTNILAANSFGDTYKIFYLTNKLEKVSFYNNYKIYSPTVDKENETITYNLKTDEIVYVPTFSVHIEMKMENGKWKINKATE